MHVCHKEIKIRYHKPVPEKKMAYWEQLMMLMCESSLSKTTSTLTIETAYQLRVSESFRRGWNKMFAMSLLTSIGYILREDE